MTRITLEVDIKNDNIVLGEEDKQRLSFIVSRVYDEYIEEIQDLNLSEQIKESSELDTIINNIKM